MKGPFNLGLLSRPVAFVAVAWIGFITIIFCLPTTNPVTSQTLNYTVVAVGIIAVFSLGSWILWAHRWFVGPVREIQEAERLGVDISEPGALEKAELEVGGLKGLKGELDGNGRSELSGSGKSELP